MQTIAIDFDGVIHQYSKGLHDGSIYDPPMPGAIQAINEFLSNDYPVFILSARPAHQIVKWLNEQDDRGFIAIEIEPEILFWDATEDDDDGHPLIGVTNRKLPALFYIDDRAIRFQNWSLAMRDFHYYKNLPEEDNHG